VGSPIVKAGDANFMRGVGGRKKRGSLKGKKKLQKTIFVGRRG